MTPRFHTGLVALALPITIAIGLASCSEPTPPTGGDNNSEAYAQYQQALQDLRARVGTNTHPSMVFVGVDQSGSMGSARVAKATSEDMQPILEALSRQGGTFAISAICERSNRPLVRETFAEPPQFDLAQVTVAPPPERPRGDRGNPFLHQQALKEYEQASQTHERDLAQASQRIEVYRTRWEQYQVDAQAKVTALQPQIEAILQHPRTCRATDIQNAVQRADWLFSEPHNWSQPPRTYAVFITDGLDTFAADPVSLKADHTILVHGNQDVGIFNAIEHQRFESPQSALAMLTTWLQAPGQN